MADTNPDILLSIGGDPGPLFKQIEALQAQISKLGSNSSVSQVATALVVAGTNADVTTGKVAKLAQAFGEIGGASKKVAKESEAAFLSVSRAIKTLQSELNKGGFSEGLQAQFRAEIAKLEALKNAMSGSRGFKSDVADLKALANEERAVIAATELFGKSFTDARIAIANSMGQMAISVGRGVQATQKELAAVGASLNLFGSGWVEQEIKIANSMGKMAKSVGKGVVSMDAELLSIGASLDLFGRGWEEQNIRIANSMGRMAKSVGKGVVGMQSELGKVGASLELFGKGWVEQDIKIANSMGQMARSIGRSVTEIQNDLAKLAAAQTKAEERRLAQIRTLILAEEKLGSWYFW